MKPYMHNVADIQKRIESTIYTEEQGSVWALLAIAERIERGVEMLTQIEDELAVMNRCTSGAR
jgi:hypothetical protein